MSIKGFEVGGVQQRYDYESLDNIPANLVQDANYVHTDNNYTNADKTKLSGIEAQANKTTIDATLTHSGQAADAKATGDAISALNAQVIASMPHDTASGAIASFPDGAAMPVIDCSVAVAPNQDLHGYDNPWPAGGGVNKLAPLASETINTGKGIIITSDGNGTYTIRGTATAEVIVDRQLPVSYTISSGDYLHLCNNSALGGVSLGLRDTTDTGITSAGASPINRVLDISSYAGRVVGYLRFYIESGVTIDMTIKPMICKSSTAISFSPYSNICPISGWTGAKVTRTGKNLLDSSEVVDGYISTSGVLTPPTSFVNEKTSGFIPIPTGTTSVTITATIQTADQKWATVAFYDENKNFISRANAVTTDTYTVSNTATVPASAKYARACWRNYNGGDIQINYGTQSPYEAPSIQTYTIDLDGTRYGGTLDVTSGKLTVDKVAVTIDGNNIKFNQIEEYGTLNRFGFAYPSGLSANYTGNTTYCLADKLTPSYDNTIGINQNRPEGYYCFPHSSAFFVSMPSSTITSIVGANAWAGDNTPKVVYPIATPIEVDLTPTQISTLLGTNNIFADCGDTTVDYYADTTLFVNKKIAAAVAALS